MLTLFRECGRPDVVLTCWGAWRANASGGALYWFAYCSFHARCDVVFALCFVVLCCDVSPCVLIGAGVGIRVVCCPNCLLPGA